MKYLDAVNQTLTLFNQMDISKIILISICVVWIPVLIWKLDKIVASFRKDSADQCLQNETAGGDEQRHSENQ